MKHLLGLVVAILFFGVMAKAQEKVTVVGDVNSEEFNQLLGAIVGDNTTLYVGSLPDTQAIELPLPSNTSILGSVSQEQYMAVYIDATSMDWSEFAAFYKNMGWAIHEDEEQHLGLCSPANDVYLSVNQKSSAYEVSGKSNPEECQMSESSNEVELTVGEEITLSGVIVDTINDCAFDGICAYVIDSDGKTYEVNWAEGMMRCEGSMQGTYATGAQIEAFGVVKTANSISICPSSAYYIRAVE